MATKTGVAGWPLVPSIHFPDELTLACPKCQSREVTLTAVYGPPLSKNAPRRMGDPGGHGLIRCETCGFRQIYF